MNFSTALVLFAVLLFQGCATSPLGRSQLTLMPDYEMNQMGLQAFDKMKKEKPIEKKFGDQSLRSLCRRCDYSRSRG